MAVPTKRIHGGKSPGGAAVVSVGAPDDDGDEVPSGTATDAAAALVGRFSKTGATKKTSLVRRGRKPGCCPGKAMGKGRAHAEPDADEGY